MNVALYVRVSTAEQAKDGYSIDEQIDRLKKYSDAMGWKVYKIYPDAGFSGASTDRPALQDMIKDVKKGLIEKVVVYKLDRLSRSQKDTLYLIEDDFLKNNCDFVSMSENFDTSTPFGRAMIGILAVFAQLEREQIKERMAMGKEGRAKEGKYHGGGWIPIGYDYIDGNLIINEFEAMQIREIHKLYQEGKAFNAIDKIFEKKGYTQKYGVWHRTRIKDCMLNDLYIGYVHFNGHKFKGNHEPIVDEETFNKSLALYESRDYSHCKHTGKSTYLGGLLFCGQCTARYGVTSWTNKKINKRHSYYSCHSRRKSNRAMIKDPNCKNKNYRMDDLDNIIFNEIKKLAFDTSYIHEIKYANLSEDDINKENLIKKEIEKIDKQKSRFMDLYGIGDFTMEELQKKIAPLNEQKKKLEKEIASLSKDESKISEEDAIKLIESFEDVLNEGDNEQIKMLVNSLIEKIVIDNDDITIYWKFA